IGGGIVELRLRGEDPIGYNAVPKGTPSWGQEFKDKSIHYANRNLAVHFKPPNYGWSFNYMDLDPTYKDKFGDPLLRVTMSISDHEKRLREFGNEKMAEVMEEIGADIVDTEDMPDDWNFEPGGGEADGEVRECSGGKKHRQLCDMESFFGIGACAVRHGTRQQPRKLAGRA